VVPVGDELYKNRGIFTRGSGSHESRTASLRLVEGRLSHGGPGVHVLGGVRVCLLGDLRGSEGEVPMFYAWGVIYFLDFLAEAIILPAGGEDCALKMGFRFAVLWELGMLAAYDRQANSSMTVKWGIILLTDSAVEMIVAGIHDGLRNNSVVFESDE